MTDPLGGQNPRYYSYTANGVMKPVAFRFEDHVRSMMFCRASYACFRTFGSCMPTVVPGCGCVVARGAAESFLQKQCCGVCKQAIIATGTMVLHAYNPVLHILSDMYALHKPVFPQLYLSSDAHEGCKCLYICQCPYDPCLWRESAEDPRWLGAQGDMSHYTVLCSTGVWTCDRKDHRRMAITTAQRIAVRCVKIPPSASDAKTAYAAFHGIFSQYYASLLCPGVAKIDGMAWATVAYGKAVLLAMRSVVCTLQGFVSSKQACGETWVLQALLFAFRQLASHVCNLHSHGIVHCNISPSSVMLAVGGGVLLTEFSAAHRHSPQFDIDLNAVPGDSACQALGCSADHVQPREMEGHVCPAVDIHGLGQTFAFAVKGWFKPDADAAQRDTQVYFHKGLLAIIQKMTEMPQKCCLVGIAADLEDLRTTLNLVRAIRARAHAHMHDSRCIAS